MRLRFLLYGLFLALALSAPAQEDEAQTYFSLNVDRPVRPGEIATVRLQASGVKKLQFRLYRVDDPVEFFRKLEDPHHFGGTARRDAKDLTPLEKFRAWKTRLRNRVRDGIRAQFSGDNRGKIREEMQARRARVAKAKIEAAGSGMAADYAAVPLLNPQRVVKVWEQPVAAGNRWESATVPVPVTERGLYLLEATDGKLQAYTIVSVTGLAMITKSAPGRLLVRVVDRVEGKPVAGVPLLVLDQGKRTEIARGQSAKDGLAEIALPEVSQEGVTVLARTQNDFTAATVYGWGLSRAEDRRAAGFVYTDRPVYRPGHTVHFKAVVRHESGSGYELPKARELTVAINDPEGKTILRKSLLVSPAGTIAGDLPLGGDAALGYYSIETDTGRAAVGGGFHVEEYRKPEYEVRVTPEKPRGFQGEPMRAAIQAKYFYGEPVAGAKVTYVVYRSRYWPPWWDEAEMGEDSSDEGGWGEEQILEENAQLDAEGRMSVTVSPARERFEYRYRVEARVTDSSQREISGAGAFLATQASFFLWAHAENYVASAGEKTRLVVEARDFDGNPAASVPFTVEVREHRWQKEGQLFATLQGQTGGDGRGVLDYTPAKPGSFKLVASAKDAAGRETVGEGYLWVSGSGDWGWGDRGERITLVPDKKSYRPGETAKVLVVTGVPGCELWVTSEGKAIHDSRFVKLSGASGSVNVRVTAAHQPNFFFEAACVKGNQLLRGSKSISVPAIEKKLTVSVTTAKSEYKPGEPATFAVEARDWQDKPVSAELSLGIVDEAIYAVKREPAGDLLNAFYGRLYNRIGTDSSFHYYFYGEAGTRRMQLARLRPSSALAQLKPERLAEARVRKAFPDTLYWAAQLNTGADGRAKVQVAFPDALTQWRATARAVTADTRVGSAVQRTTVRKNLILTMATPRFLTESDEIGVPFIVRNYLKNEATVRTSLQVKGVEMLSAPAAECLVATRGEAKLDARLRAGMTSPAVLLGKALSAEESDALELSIPVQPAGLKLAESRSGVVDAASGKASVTLTFPAAATPYTRELVIQVTPSLAGALFGALEYLSTYPYGCTEQTMSSFLPNVIVTRAAKELGLPLKMDPGELPRRVRAGLERLYDFQHADGGWGFWRGDDSEPFMTAYVTYGLHEARDAGYKVREDVLARAVASLDAQWKTGGSWSADLRAYALYALSTAGRYDRSRWETVWKDQARLSPMGLALMGLTARAGKDSRADSIAGTLESAALREGAQVRWKAERDELMDFYWDISTEATAYVVKFLAAQRPQSALLPGAVEWLIANRNGGYYWSSTKQTAMVVYGLTDYLKQSGELKPDFTATVMLNGRKALERRFTAADALSPEPAVLRVKDAAAANTIDVVKSGSGVLYWSARGDYFDRAAAGSSTGGELSVRREYYRLAPLTEDGKIRYNLEPLTGAAKVGDTLAVRLIVKGAEWRYLLVEDAFPSGAEAIARDDRYDLKNKPYEWDYWYQRRELRDNRAVWYDRWFPKGKKHYVYLLKVTHAGKFQVNPARVQPMYQPGVLASSEGFVLEVQP